MTCCRSTFGSRHLIGPIACACQAVANEFFNALGSSYTLGSAPTFNLARCLGQDPSLATFSTA